MEKIKIDSPIFTIIFSIPIETNYKEIILNNPSLLDSFLEEPIEWRDWSVRVKNVFKIIGFRNIKDIFNNFDKLSLFKYRNFGKKSFDEVIDKTSIYLQRYINSIDIRSDSNQVDIVTNRVIDVTKGILGLVCRDKINILSKIFDDEKLNELLNTSIVSIDWSVRSINVFKKVRIQKIGDFSMFNVEKLMNTSNFGKKSLTEIFNKLGNYIDEFTDEEKEIKQLIQQVVSCDLVKLVKYMLSKLPEKENRIISRRYGLWDGKRKTLDNIGKEFKVTRERIRQIQNSAIKRLKKFNLIEIVDVNKEFFDVKLRPFMEANFNIANKSELLQIIYSIDGGNIEVDLANEFLSEVFFESKSIFNNFVIEFDREVVGLNENDKELYFKVIKLAKDWLYQRGIPQNIDDLLLCFDKVGLIKDHNNEREKLKRFLLVSSIPRDTTGKFGLRKWKFFNPSIIYRMAERALIEINKPAHFTQIALLMNKMFPAYAPFNVNNVHSRIGSIKEIFVWVSPGVYGLKRWGLKRPPYIKDYLIKVLQLTNRHMHINELTEKALEKCNCTISSVFMTLSLNKDIFIEYPDKFYGLIEWK